MHSDLQTPAALYYVDRDRLEAEIASATEEYVSASEKLSALKAYRLHNTWDALIVSGRALHHYFDSGQRIRVFEVVEMRPDPRGSYSHAVHGTRAAFIRPVFTGRSLTHTGYKLACAEGAEARWDYRGEWRVNADPDQTWVEFQTQPEALAAADEWVANGVLPESD